MESIAGVGAFLFFRKHDHGTKSNDFICLGVIVCSLGLIVYGENLEKQKKAKEKESLNQVLLDAEKDDPSPPLILVPQWVFSTVPQ